MDGTAGLAIPAAPNDRRTLLRTIERETKLRGLVLTLREQIVSDDGPAPDGARLVAIIQAAWAASEGAASHAHVMQITAAIAKNAAARSGPVRVSRTAWLLLVSYAETGAVPMRDDAVIAQAGGSARSAARAREPARSRKGGAAR